MELILENIKKSFGPVDVLNGISFKLGSGQVLGLVGENGAGKSTLMNVLGGIEPPSSGRIFVNGSYFQPISPIDAREKGISFIHQELNLFPNLTIAENVFIHHLPTKKKGNIRVIDRKAMRSKTKALMDNVGLKLHPETKIERLSPAQQQMVEIIKALNGNPRIIIFDEPTTSLSRHEAEKLFQLISELKSRGIAIIYISHNLDDVVHLSDNIMVLRDGTLVGNHHQGEVDIPQLVKEMVGRKMRDFFPAHHSVIQPEELMKVENIFSKGFVDQVSFSINKGEILGLYGLVGAGRSELARIIYGLDPHDSGTIYWKGEKIHHLSPEKNIKRGIAFLTEDRQKEGLLSGMNILKNTQLASLTNYTHRWLNKIRSHEVAKRVEQQVKETRTKYQNLTHQLVSTLSGGNQQKVVLSKWLLTEPELFILDEPTKGIDIGAKREIYDLIKELVKKGTGVLMISSELEELIGLCDRIVVMSAGKVTDELTRNKFDRQVILEAALHKK